MHRVALLIALAGCGFEPRSAGTPGPADAPHTDANGEPTVDAAVDAAIDAAVDASALDPECPDAPAGCTAFGCTASADSCYYLCTGPRDANAAQTVCRSLMGEESPGCLVTLNSIAEQTCVVMEAASASAADFYLGWVQDMNGQEPGGGWGWLCGSSTHTPLWGNNEPNNGSFPNPEDCAVMNVVGSMTDVGCNEDFRFVCEVHID